jgi:hypothetical protein
VRETAARPVRNPPSFADGGRRRRKEVAPCPTHPELWSSQWVAREARLRRRARRYGLVLRKDRARSFNADHFGGYMLIDADRNVIVRGERYELDLADVEACLDDVR